MKLILFDTFNGNNTTICLINTSYNTMTMLLEENKLFFLHFATFCSNSNNNNTRICFFRKLHFYIVYCILLLTLPLFNGWRKGNHFRPSFRFLLLFLYPFPVMKVGFFVSFHSCFFRKDSLTLLACQYNLDS